MQSYNIRSMFLYIPLVTFALSIANAQTLVGCDAVSCPTTGGQTHCTVGNTTMSELGITSFNTSLNTSPFTWTLGIQETFDPVNKSLASWDRDFFLGTPPSISNLTSSTHGCALFFDGISPNLFFQGNDSSGTCQDALSSQCVNDLLSQSQSEMVSLLKNSTGSQTESNICSELQSALQSQAPTSCTAAASHNWGTINVQELTGSNAPTPSQNSSDCHATTGEDYNLSFVHSTRFTGEIGKQVGVLNQFGHGITPILTVFYDMHGTTNTSAETHLSCLKLVESTEGMVASGASGIKRVYWSWAVIGLWAFYVLV
ncbi:hypothetical protein NHQ30_009221 [Ciborinia camelliae]|nr:hypothetical protein NHQ30_009221 [Ciborinia camelliae]